MSSWKIVTVYHTRQKKVLRQVSRVLISIAKHGDVSGVVLRLRNPMYLELIGQ